MAKLKKNTFIKFIKSHRWTVGVCAGILVVALGVGGVAIAQENIKIANTQKAIEMTEENGGISTDSLELLEENGGFADFGTEIVDPETGETVILTQNVDGSISKVKANDSSNGGISSSSESGHNHSYIPHYATGTRDVTTPVYHPAVTQRVCVKQAGIYCNTCGKMCNTAAEQDAHEHGGWHYMDAQYEDQVVQAAYTENVVTQEQYQYVDYYYCSECGEKN